MSTTTFRQIITDPAFICEKTTAQLTLQLTDHADVALAGASVSAVALTLYNRRDGAILNSRTAQSVLNANGGTLAAGGLLTMILSELDNVLTSQTPGTEEHVALFEWTWASGTRFGKKEVTFTVANQLKVT